MTPAALVADLRRRGARLSVRGDRLRIEAPTGILTPELTATLAAHKPAIMALLADWRSALTPAERRRLPDGFDPPASYAAALLRVRDVFDGEIMDAAALVLGPFVETPTGYLTPSKLPANWREAYEERAAIVEFDGGLPRERAEAAALSDVLAAMQRAGAWPFGGPDSKNGGGV